MHSRIKEMLTELKSKHPKLVWTYEESQNEICVEDTSKSDENKLGKVCMPIEKWEIVLWVVCYQKDRIFTEEEKKSNFLTYYSVKLSNIDNKKNYGTEVRTMKVVNWYLDSKLRKISEYTEIIDDIEFYEIHSSNLTINSENSDKMKWKCNIYVYEVLFCALLSRYEERFGNSMSKDRRERLKKVHDAMKKKKLINKQERYVSAYDSSRVLKALGLGPITFEVACEDKNSAFIVLFYEDEADEGAVHLEIVLSMYKSEMMFRAVGAHKYETFARKYTLKNNAWIYIEDDVSLDNVVTNEGISASIWGKAEFYKFDNSTLDKILDIK